MTSYIPTPDPITPARLTAVLHQSGLLAQGQVLAVASAPVGAFNSYTIRLQAQYSVDERYHALLQVYGVKDYWWEQLVVDYKTGLIYWLLVPVQDRYGGSSKEYWWPKMQCLVAAFRDWSCHGLLGMPSG